MTNNATLKIGLSCRIGLLVLPPAGAVSGKLSRGACPNGAGRDQIFPLRFYPLTDSKAGGITMKAGLSR